MVTITKPAFLGDALDASIRMVKEQAGGGDAAFHDIRSRGCPGFLPEEANESVDIHPRQACQIVDGDGSWQLGFDDLHGASDPFAGHSPCTPATRGELLQAFGDEGHDLPAGRAGGIALNECGEEALLRLGDGERVGFVLGPNGGCHKMYIKMAGFPLGTGGERCFRRNEEDAIRGEGDFLPLVTQGHSRAGVPVQSPVRSPEIAVVPVYRRKPMHFEQVELKAGNGGWGNFHPR